VVWHDRRTASGEHPDGGTPLLKAVQAARPAGDTQVWVACEAPAVRRIRAQLLDHQARPRAQVTTRGYWRLGRPDHPGHDFGED